MLRRIKFWGLGTVIAIALFIPTRMLVHRLIDPPFEKWMESRNDAKKQAIKEEAKRRRVEGQKTDNGSVVKPRKSPVDSTDTPTDRTSPISTHAINRPQNSPDPPSGLLPAGPYEGMTPEEVHALEQRKFENIQRLKANTDKLRAASDLRSQNIDDEDRVMLSIFKSLSPQQLKHVREEALKKFPAEDVDFFFNDLENKGIEMTEDQLTAEAQRILASNEALDIVFRELRIEREELEQEYRELYGDDE